MQIKIITLNLLHGGLYFNAIENFLKKENSDILCLQEVYAGKDKNLPRNLKTIDELHKIFLNYFFHFAPEFLFNRKEGKIDMGSAIFSRFPIVKHETIFYDTPYGEYQIPNLFDSKFDFSVIPRNLEFAQIKVDKTMLNIFNTHGIWGRHGNDTDRRLKMGETIIKNIGNKNNVILCGDFNLSPATQTIANIEKFLFNIFKNNLTTTFNVKFKPESRGYEKTVVDMMFASKNIQIIKSYQPKVDVSDHFPLACIIDLS